jgi:hypothetical protein
VNLVMSAHLFDVCAQAAGMNANANQCILMSLVLLGPDCISARRLRKVVAEIRPAPDSAPRRL